MKKLLIILILLFSINIYSQDTLYTAKSIYKGKYITGYVIAKITKDTTIFIRINKYSKLNKTISWKKQYKLYIENYPKNLLYLNEEYRNNLRSNRL